MPSGDLSLYIAGKSWLHSLSPLTKLTFVLLTGVAVYCVPGDQWPDAMLLSLNIALAAMSGVFPRVWKFTWRTLFPIALFMVPIHGFLSPENSIPLITYHGIILYTEGVKFAGATILQLAAIITVSLLFVFTTDPADFITALTQAGCSSSIAYLFGSPLLMLPAMRARTSVIQDAQRARGLDSQGSFMKRIRSIPPLVAPLVLGAFAEIEQRAIALELRGFNSSCVKTSLRIVPDSRLQRILRWMMLFACLLLVLYKTVLSNYVIY